MSTQPLPSPYKYKAFISYSHQADAELAPVLQSGLQKFNTSWNQLYAMRVFRDETDAPITTALPTLIEKALGESEYFLLLASRKAARSKWVEKEVAYWLANRSPETLFIVLTDGELTWEGGANEWVWNEQTPLPPNLRGVFGVEPKYTDLRWAKEEGNRKKLKLHSARFYDAVADLASALLKIDKGVLVGQDARKQRRTKMLAGSAVAALFLLLVAATAAAYIAYGQRQQALTQQRIAEGNAREARRQQRLAEENSLRAFSEGVGAVASGGLAVANEREAQRQRGLAEASAVEARRQQGIAETQRAEAVRQRRTAEERLARSYFSESGLEHDNGDTERAIVLAAEALRVAPEHDPLHDIYALRAIQLGANAPNDIRLLPENSFPVALDPRAETLFANAERGAKLWSFAGVGRGPFPALSFDSGATTPRFSPDGRWVAGQSIDYDGRTNTVRSKLLAVNTADMQAHELQFKNPVPDENPPTPEFAFTSDSALLLIMVQQRVSVFDPETGLPYSAAPLGPSLLGISEQHLSLNPGRDWVLMVDEGAPDSVRVVDLRTGAPPAGAPPYLKHEGAVSSAAFSRDGRWIATASAAPDGNHVRLSLWDLNSWTRKNFSDVSAESSRLLSVQDVSPGEKVLATACQECDGTVRREGWDYVLMVWDSAQNKWAAASKRFTPDVDAQVDNSLRRSVKFVGRSVRFGGGDDSLVLAVDTLRSSVDVLDAATLQPVRNAIQVPDSVGLYDVDAAGKTLRAVCDDRRIMRWNLAEREREYVSVAAAGAGRSGRRGARGAGLSGGAFSAGARSALVQSRPPEAQDGAETAGPGRLVAINPDGSLSEKLSAALAAFDDLGARYFYVGGDRYIAVAWAKPYEGDESEWTPDKPAKSLLQLLDAETGRALLAQPLDVEGVVQGVSYEPRASRLTLYADSVLDGNRYAQNVQQWDVRAGTKVLEGVEVPPSLDEIYGFVAGGRLLVSARGSEEVIVWSCDGGAAREQAHLTFRETSRVNIHFIIKLLQQATDVRLLGPNAVQLRLSREAEFLVETGAAGARVRNLTRDLPVSFPRAFAKLESLEEVAFSRNGRWVAIRPTSPDKSGTGNTSRVTQVWALDTGTPLTEPQLHPAPILDAAFTDDGERLLTLAADGLLRRWYVGGTSARKPEWLAQLGAVLTGKQPSASGTSLMSPEPYRRLRERFRRAVGREARADARARLVARRLNTRF